MSKITKIFTIISFLFFVAGVKCFLETQSPSADRPGNQHPNPDPAPIRPSEAAASDAVKMGDVPWNGPEASPKGEHWTFDLFTAPTISRDGGNFVAALPWLKKSQSTVNFEVISVARRLYPLRFSGYFAAPTVDGLPSADGGYTFMLRGGAIHESLAVKLGQNLEKYGVEIRKFEEKSAAGETQGYPRLTLFDRSIGREVTLTAAPQYYDALWDIKLRLKAEGKEILLSRTGENFSVGSECYALESVDAEGKLLTFSQKIGKSAQNFSLAVAPPVAENKNPPPKH
ncbi:MAG: hypothetical protein LBJ81_01275 [Puniceicoccales bacterium]|jgi:hypothetical protein|nr:hypothetical protein [Puniceicoccales bacterium]